MVTPKQRHNILKVLQFTALWILFGSLYAIVEYGIMGDTTLYPATQNPYNSKENFLYVILGSGLLGLVLGAFENIWFTGLFTKKSFFVKIFFKTIFYLTLIIIFLVFLAMLFASNNMDVPIYDPLVLNSLSRFWGTFSFLSIIIYISVIFIFILFMAEIRDNLGMFVFANFIRGKYHKPLVEERIFMFMDMKGSTALAEKLGHIKYYRLLNDYYSDMSDAIINTHGQIYQYVGDEVIITWPLKEGLKMNNCILCFFEIKLTLAAKERAYINEYGVVPTFKAAMHCGKVTTGEIGKLKKEIVYTGDVLNTTSRIQERCNEFEAELLVSKKLLDLLPQNDSFSQEPIGQIELRGKNKKVEISRLSLWSDS